MKNDSRLSTETFFEVIETLLGFSNSPNHLYQFDKYEKLDHMDRVVVTQRLLLIPEDQGLNPSNSRSNHQRQICLTNGQSYRQFKIVNYDSRVIGKILV